MEQKKQADSGNDSNHMRRLAVVSGKVKGDTYGSAVCSWFASMPLGVMAVFGVGDGAER